MEAVVQLEGNGLVVEGGEHLSSNLALGGQGASGEGLQDLVSVVGAGAGLHGEDQVERVGNADPGENDGLLGLVDDQVEAGGFAVEEDADHDGEAGPLLLILVVHPGVLDSLDVGPQENLQVLDNLPLSNLNPILYNYLQAAI